MTFARVLTMASLGAACAGEAAPAGPAPETLGVGLLQASTYRGEPFLPGPDDLWFEELATGTRFNLAGQAFEGPLAAERVQLTVLPAITAFWFAWSVHYPGAEVWKRRVNNAEHVIGTTGGCGVPCDEIISGCPGGRDCIRPIASAEWATAEQARAFATLTDDDRVLGIARNGLARAYPLDALWTHEVVNDTWGTWELSVTYCPLTGSGVLADAAQGPVHTRFGVSGNLWNSNLVLYDHATESQWVQMRLVGVTGPRQGASLATAGLVDTTWGTWRRLYPQTEVLAERYNEPYPYGSYRERHGDTFRVTNPPPDPLYPNKSYAIGLTAGGHTKIWAFAELYQRLEGDRGIVEDWVGDLPVLVAFDGAGPTAVVLSRLRDGQELRFGPSP
ncbi:MAG: DUF3179 domain-containing protein [Myxococcales bacterium]|nr:DUF3179 domain-containing protein [Myxococcales bacterium]